VLSENFILYKTLLGDASDKVQGVKGLGEKGIMKHFPELQTKKLTLEEIFEISALKFKDHIVYSRVVHDQKRLETNFKIMNLSIPMVGDYETKYVENLIESDLPELNPTPFLVMYEEDKLGGIIRNVDYWLKDNFLHFKGYKNK
jgi:5'-3' exonuclease